MNTQISYTDLTKYITDSNIIELIYSYIDYKRVYLKILKKRVNNMMNYYIRGCLFEKLLLSLNNPSDAMVAYEQFNHKFMFNYFRQRLIEKNSFDIEYIDHIEFYDLMRQYVL